MSVLLFGADIKLAGSLSPAVSLPTMLVEFTRYSRDQSFSVFGCNGIFLVLMAAGSVVGIVPSGVLLPFLSLVLVVSAVRVWRHG